MRANSLTSKSLLHSLLRGVLMVFVAGMLVAPAMAVRPYTYPPFKQPKAKLKGEKSIGMFHPNPFKLKKPRSNAITRNGSVPEFQRKHWSWGTIGRK